MSIKEMQGKKRTLERAKKTGAKTEAMKALKICDLYIKNINSI